MVEGGSERGHLEPAEQYRLFERRLEVLGIRKADVARALGVVAASVTRWRERGVPQYVWAYLDVRLSTLDVDTRLARAEARLAEVRRIVGHE